VGHGLEELCGLKVKISDLKGPGTIPASAVQVRYARLNGSWFDVLDDMPPRYVPMHKKHGAALQPIWLNVHFIHRAGDSRANGTMSAWRYKAKK